MCPAEPGRKPESHDRPQGAWHHRELGEKLQDQGLVLAVTSRGCDISPGSGIREPGGLQVWARWGQVLTESTLKGCGWPAAQECPLSWLLEGHGTSSSLKSTRQCGFEARPEQNGPGRSAHNAVSRALHSVSVHACACRWDGNFVKQ